MFSKFLVAMVCGISLAATSSFGEDLSEDARNEVDRQPNIEHSASAVEAPSNQSEFQDAAASWDKFMDEHAENIRDIENEQLDLLHRIALARVKDEGIEALHTINESLHDADVRLGVLGHLLEEMSQNDPQLAFDAAITLRKDGEGGTFVWNVVQNWAASDPQSALEHVATAGLGADLLRELRETVVRDWATRDPRGLFGNVEHLPEGLLAFGQREALRSWARKEPETAALRIGAIQAVEDRRIAATAIARNWLRQDVSEAISWAQTSPDLEDVRRDVLVGVLQDLAEREPTLAFDTALQHPIQDSEIGLEASVIARIAANDADEAMNLLQEVRSGATKASAYTSVGMILAQKGDFDRAMGLSRQLPEASRTIYTGTVVASWGIANPTKVVEEIDQLPTDDLKAQAALMALSGDQQQKKLSKDQVEKLKTYMPEEMLKVYEQVQHMAPISQ